MRRFEGCIQATALVGAEINVNMVSCDLTARDVALLGNRLDRLLKHVSRGSDIQNAFAECCSSFTALARES